MYARPSATSGTPCIRPGAAAKATWSAAKIFVRKQRIKIIYFLFSPSRSSARKTTMTNALVGCCLGIVLGMRHATEPDHLTAVTTLSLGTKSPWQSALLGAAWGLGHTLALLALCGVLLIMQRQLRPTELALLELVGVMLMAIGAMALHRALREGRRKAFAAPPWRRAARASDVRSASALRSLYAGAKAAAGRLRAWSGGQRRADSSRAGRDADPARADALHCHVRRRLCAGHGDALWSARGPACALGRAPAPASRTLFVRRNFFEIGFGGYWTIAIAGNFIR